MAIVIKRRRDGRTPSPIVPANDLGDLSREQQLNFVRALARDLARRDHALATSQGV